MLIGINNKISQGYAYYLTLTIGNGLMFFHAQFINTLLSIH